MEVPQTHYARSGDVAIAYQVVGDGPVDIVWVPGFAQHVELAWEEPYRRRWLEGLARFARVVVFDKRGTGLSDRVSTAQPLETRMDDIRAVLDAAGSSRAVVLCAGDGGPLGIAFAASHPDRVAALVLAHSWPAATWRPDMPWLPSREAAEHSVEELERNWSDPEYWDGYLAPAAPSLTPEERKVFARVIRLSVSPGNMAEYSRVNLDVDVRDVLAIVSVPTLVLERRRSASGGETARYLAKRIPGARLVEVEGADSIPVVGDVGPLLAAIRAFIEEARVVAESEPERVLATVLFTDLVESTARAVELGDAKWRELLHEHHLRVRRELARFRGREIDTAGDGFFAAFDGPARAIRCACAVRDSLRELDLDIRAGLHTGECEVIDGKFGGIAVVIGARVAAEAGVGEVLVSQTVRDLVAGSGLNFADRGPAGLKGVPGEWRLYAVAP